MNANSSAAEQIARDTQINQAAMALHAQFGRFNADDKLYPVMADYIDMVIAEAVTRQLLVVLTDCNTAPDKNRIGIIGAHYQDAALKQKRATAQFHRHIDPFQRGSAA